MSDQTNVPVEPEAPAPVTPGRPPVSPGQNVLDFTIGFLAGVVLNWLLIYALKFGEGWAPWVLNIGLLILTFTVADQRKRPMIAFGLLMLYVIAGGYWFILMLNKTCSSLGL